LFIRLVFFFTFLAFLGCGPSDGLSRIPVKGKITAIGEPLTGALVRFVPLQSNMGYGGSAVTDANGAFILIDSRGFPGGIVAGEYLVAISKLVKPEGAQNSNKSGEDDPSGGRETMPVKLTSAEQSPLRFTVEKGGADALIDIPAEMLEKKRK
jgi:hypothetical protein